MQVPPVDDGGGRSIQRTGLIQEESKKRPWTAQQDQLLTKLVQVILSCPGARAFYLYIFRPRVSLNLEGLILARTHEYQQTARTAGNQFHSGCSSWGQALLLFREAFTVM